MASNPRYGIDEESDRITAHIMLLTALGHNPYVSINYEDEEHFDIPEPSPSSFQEPSPSSFHHTKPAAKWAVSRLPCVVQSKWEPCGSGVPCAVCKEEIRVGERMKELPCTHWFHDECIGPWLKLRNTCPLCRYELPLSDEKDCVRY